MGLHLAWLGPFWSPLPSLPSLLPLAPGHWKVGHLQWPFPLGTDYQMLG